MFVIRHISRSRAVRRESNGIFMFLLLVCVQVCLMLLMIDASPDFFFFSPSSFKRVQFLEEKLSLSHLHFLCHTCFYPG